MAAIELVITIRLHFGLSPRQHMVFQGPSDLQEDRGEDRLVLLDALEDPGGAFGSGFDEFLRVLDVGHVEWRSGMRHRIHSLDRLVERAFLQFPTA